MVFSSIQHVTQSFLHILSKYNFVFNTTFTFHWCFQSNNFLYSKWMIEFFSPHKVNFVNYQFFIIICLLCKYRGSFPSRRREISHASLIFEHIGSCSRVFGWGVFGLKSRYRNFVTCVSDIFNNVGVWNIDILQCPLFGVCGTKIILFTQRAAFAH